MSKDPGEDLVDESATDATGEAVVDEKAVDGELAVAAGEGEIDVVVGIGGEEEVGADVEPVRDDDNADRGR